MPQYELPTLAQAKWAFTTRRVVHDDVHTLQPLHSALKSGDLLLGRVQSLGQHAGVQLAGGRRAELYRGDLIVLCLGDRYAPDQFEGVAQLGLDGGCELLAAGGVAGTVRQRHGRMREATGLQALACLADVHGRSINISRYALVPPRAERPGMPVLLVVGSSMNAGKTTACASVIHGLARAGLRVGAVKITGTGSFGDVQSYADAGASEVLDFTDAGFASTYRAAPAALERAALSLLSELETRGCEVAVAEVADGLFQCETAHLLSCASLRHRVCGALFAAADAMGAVAGVQRLHSLGWHVPGFTGLITASPLAAAEATQALAAAGAAKECFTREDLRDPGHALGLFGRRRDAASLMAA